MLAQFAAERPERVAAFEAAIAEGDVARVAQLAHGLKGMSATVGASAVDATARALLEAARPNDPAALGPLGARRDADA